MQAEGAAERVEFSTVETVVADLKSLAILLCIVAVVGPALFWRSADPPAGRSTLLFALSFTALLAGVLILCTPMMLFHAGRGVADADGLRYKPLLRRERHLRWSNLERLRWTIVGDFRGGGARIVLSWHKLDQESRRSL